MRPESQWIQPTQGCQQKGLMNTPSDLKSTFKQRDLRKSSGLWAIHWEGGNYSNVPVKSLLQTISKKEECRTEA